MIRESSQELEKVNVKVPRESFEVHPELESLVSRLRKKGMSYRKISEFLKEEHGYSVSFKSVERILKDIDWMKKERRRMRRSETV